MAAAEIPGPRPHLCPLCPPNPRPHLPSHPLPVVVGQHGQGRTTVPSSMVAAGVQGRVLPSAQLRSLYRLPGQLLQQGLLLELIAPPARPLPNAANPQSP